ncbi:ABC transporter ATP-binding protein [Lapidilactobacillus achengensis]|uniref:ABC transporter ATP-binding protein n=1 Tax=Lapidilactobacillus achengensis TaxID=2486000 RepID=A0ABW1ULS9_9LACO|nr:ABC transporter ATP-binding protein [Lapidilactobacillus achengensis]
MLKTLSRSIRQYKGLTILSPILVAVEVAVETFIPFLMGNIIDDGIQKSDMSYITKYGLILLAMAIFSLICGAAASWVAPHAAAGYATNLRHDLFYHIQDFSFANIDHFSGSSLVTRLTTDISNVQMGYQMMIRMTVRAPLLFLFSIMMAFRVNSQLALVFVVMIPILAIFLVLILHAARPLFRVVFRRYDTLNRVVRENIRGVQVVKTYVRADEESDKFKRASKGIADVFTKAQRIMSLNGPAMMLILNLSLLLLSWFGAKLIVGGSLQTGELVSMYAYSNSILFSLNMLAMVFTQLSIAQASGERITAVLQDRPTINDPKDPIKSVANGAIEFQHVNFTFNDSPREILQDINLQIKSGEVIGIIGETGAGKSSLVQLIPRLYDVSHGRLRIGGHNVRHYDLRTLRDNVAMVLQNNVLFSGTIAENLRWGNEDASDEELIAAAKIAQADGFINEFPDGYQTHIEQGGSNVSGGQLQRLTIARALLKKPKILILDDSTSAVDTTTERMIREGLAEDLPDTTKIIISQRIVSIKDADQIIVMDRGQIQAVGTHDELVKSNALYRDIYQYQEKKAGDEANG